ncbi:tRNA (adenosine(37)-N6)-threonylcarbamoyltransferase complex dimerization subunit type 1 TsaB [Gordonia defluvii]|jgi:tRNA threonylcarbamoyl adenosine modification protein YeaZ|uniref:tRNA (Adenosine(37)-N6)-threonylcarbamoyltransferase complex dimerization subunit type 1 TsaB n=1 Tax=Gordonia defluvii TaxID=283718 RepID=A0ABP6KYR1_9ACTN|nr:tRNA (adenosine(37)-N6)-threonylcarbamoyltransferase complex dimerization subunit type 1 TsaB [Gordonia sp. UBA5067]
MAVVVVSGRRVLVIDTATDAIVTGLVTVRAGGVDEVSSRTVVDHRRHAEMLTTLMRECLTESGWRGVDVDAVVVGCGPGPFTGLRVGMATAAAYGDALGIPVYGVGTLDAIAAAAARGSQARSILVVTDARRREVYWARYADGRRVGGPGVSAPAVLQAELAAEPVDLIAGGAPPHWAGGTEPASRNPGRPVVDVAPDVVGLASVIAPALLAGSPPDPLVPLYLRRPDAVELADQKKKRGS